MSIRITVKSPELVSRTTKGGRTLYEQTAYAHICDRNGQLAPYPERIRLTIWGNAQGQPEHPAYAPGDYTLAPTSFYVGDFGALNCSPRLVAVQSAAKS